VHTNKITSTWGDHNVIWNWRVLAWDVPTTRRFLANMSCATRSAPNTIKTNEVTHENMHTNFRWSCYELEQSNLGYKPRIGQAIPIVPFPPMLLAVFTFITSCIHVNWGGRTFKLHLMILNEPNIHDNIGTLNKWKRWWMPWELNIWNGGIGIQDFGFVWKSWTESICIWNEGFMCECSHITLVAIIGCNCNLGH
jgi:hypothetical protein